jgi:peptidoglycan/xylan/chitin deacetylase (PgdA/CDA1 family)
MRRLSRRSILMLGAMGLSVATASRLGLLKLSGGDDHASDVLVVHEDDPTATPLIYPSGSVPSPSPTPSKSAAQGRPAWSSDLLSQVVRTGPAGGGLVGLTIDDGWLAQDAVLQALGGKKVQPTLFLTGRAVKNDPQFIRRAVDAGCEIGNHTMDHAWLTDKSADYIQKDLQDFEAFVRAVAPETTTLPYMRPSGGAINQTVIDASARLGYRPVLWSAATGDSSSSTTSDQMVRNALSSANAGAILLTHFSQRTATALPQIIDGLRAKGLEPVSLTRLFAQPA